MSEKKIPKALRIILFGILGLILLIVVVGFLSPKNVHVERSMTMNADANTVFAQVNELRNWDNWSTWAQIDPDGTEWTYSDSAATGKDAWYSWKSEHKNVGNGKLTILESDKPNSIKTQIDFEGQGTSNGAWVFEPTKDGTKVTWSMDIDMGNNPIGRIMGLMMDGMIGSDFEKGLTNMKKVVE